MTATTLSANVFPGIASRTTGIATSSRYMAVGDSTRGNRTARPYLTKRQLQVLALLCEGLPNKLICRELGISAGTCKAHMSSILRELGVGSRLQAVVEARRRDLLGASGEARDILIPRGEARPVAQSRSALCDSQIPSQ